MDLEKLEPHLIFVYALFWKVANFLFTLSTKEDHQNRRFIGDDKRTTFAKAYMG